MSCRALNHLTAWQAGTSRAFGFGFGSLWIKHIVEARLYCILHHDEVLARPLGPYAHVSIDTLSHGYEDGLHMFTCFRFRLCSVGA